MQGLNNYISASPQDKNEKELEYFNLLVNTSLENYETYFESDLEEEFKIVKELPIDQKIEFVETLEYEPYNEFIKLNQMKEISIDKGKDSVDDYGFTYKLAHQIQETDKIMKMTNVDELNFQETWAKTIKQEQKEKLEENKKSKPLKKE